MNIQLQFEILNIEDEASCDYDYLNVSDAHGDLQQSTFSTKVCGNEAQDITLNGNKGMLHFQLVYH